eukprot:TRINITY_DN3252_c0_g1_i1.p1 TRINITY_DN3252_c0_g1~~TRINITY_DN3252_c0_g1_i1.p1  ORF type:complete len:508 (+),score=72.30 TRINITY_DN3252_c0_g1_i1:677-2200(+)
MHGNGEAASPSLANRLLSSPVAMSEFDTTPLHDSSGVAEDKETVPPSLLCGRFPMPGEATRVTLGGIAGLLFGIILKYSGAGATRFVDVVEFPGLLWLRGLKLVMLPLIASNMVTSMATLKGIPNSRKLGAFTVGYYLLTTLLAAANGLLFSNLLVIPFARPIDSTALPASVTANFKDSVSKLAKREMLDQFFAIFYGIVPDNIIGACVDNNLLGVIMFAIAVGMVLDAEKSCLLRGIQEFSDVMGKLVAKLVWWTPLGVACLVASKVAVVELGPIAQNVGVFLGAVMLGLFVHCAIVYPFLFFLFVRRSPLPYMKEMLPAMFTALGTSSSAATLPVTTRCAIHGNAVPKPIADFVLPLGATINMDGTAIGFPIATIFLACLQGISLSFPDQLMIAFVSSLSSVGAAPIPSAGLVLLLMITETVGIPLTATFGLIVAVDWIYDRPETMVNVMGDSFAAVIVQHRANAFVDRLGEDEEMVSVSVLSSPPTSPPEIIRCGGDTTVAHRG